MGDATVTQIQKGDELEFTCTYLTNGDNQVQYNVCARLRCNSNYPFVVIYDETITPNKAIPYDTHTKGLGLLLKHTNEKKPVFNNGVGVTADCIFVAFSATEFEKDITPEGTLAGNRNHYWLLSAETLVARKSDICKFIYEYTYTNNIQEGVRYRIYNVFFEDENKKIVFAFSREKHHTDQMLGAQLINFVFDPTHDEYMPMDGNDAVKTFIGNDDFLQELDDAIENEKDNGFVLLKKAGNM